MQIRGYDHVGIRVSDRERALDFYAKLGFAPDPEFTTDRVAEIVAGDGTRINLIFNGVAQPSAHNILLDEDVKPGLHARGLHRRAARRTGRMGELRGRRLN